MTYPSRAGQPVSGPDSPGEIDLGRVWTAVAAEVWRRPPGRIERVATRLLRSPGLARALVTTPSLLLPWLISTVVVFGAGALVRLGPGQPAVWLVAPAVAAVGIAFAYGPGIDPAWELSSSCAVSDRVVLLTRAVAVFALNAVLGLVASAASGAAAALTFGWLLPDDRGVRAGARGGRGRQVRRRRRRRRGGRLGDHGARDPDRQRPDLTVSVTNANAYLPYLAVAVCCAAIAVYALRPQRGLQ